MIKLDIAAIETCADDMRRRHGGTIFSFPVEPENPFSEYAVTVFTGEGYKTFPNSLNIQNAAGGIHQILEGFKKSGIDADYGRNVRLASYEAQVNAPDVTMRRLKKENVFSRTLNESADVSPIDGGEYAVSARGLIKFSYLSMVEDKLPKAIEFMDKYYQLLAMRKYGMTAAAIKQEVRRMNKDEAVQWIEQTYSKYVRDDMEVMNIMESLKGSPT